MKQRVQDLIQQGDRLFSKRGSLHTLWQSIADNFYPERADFTRKRVEGDEFASHLMTGAPVLARRDLANSLSSILRPITQPWFFARTDNDDINEDATALKWLDAASDRMRRIMYNPKAQFVRATKQGDNDFSAFGQCVISVDRNKAMDGLLYRAWHLRDVAWCENSELEIDTIHRKWKLDARSMVELFPKTVHDTVRKSVEKEPYKEYNCRHIVMPSHVYDLPDDMDRKRKLPFISIVVDVDNQTILEEVPVLSIGYVIPRWVTVSGSQYAYSPASTIALPDARMLQAIGLTLLEAGQKAVDPPMIAKGEAIAGAVNTFAGGTTWVEADYDENSGDALRILPGSDKHQFQFGLDREAKIHEMISEAFYLNQLALPDLKGDMTAFEVQKRVEEYMRRARPLFEPMEAEYNGGLCEMTFDSLLRMGAFGSPLDMPPILANQNVRFQFESPLAAAADRAKASAFNSASQLLATAMEIDPTVKRDLDVDKAFRDALSAVGVPSKWIRPEEESNQLKAQDRDAAAKQAAVENATSLIHNGAAAAEQVGAAKQSLQAAGVG